MKTTLTAILLSAILFIPLATIAQINPNHRQPASVAKNKAQTQVDHRTQASGWLKDDKTGFVENKGQLRDESGKPNAAVKYLLNMPGLNVQLRATGFSYDAWTEEKDKQGKSQNNEEKTASLTRKFHRVDIELEGANSNAVLVAEEPLAETLNIINERGSFEGIHSYRKITYRNIYRGIDLEFVARKGTDKPVEYNFIVHPGADASQIKLKYNSGSDISLKNGMIEMNLAFGVLKEKIPASYTEQDGKALAVRYTAEDELKNVYAFHVPDYDKRKTLVIDPTPSLVWATYYGGSSASSESVSNIDVDAAGNIYIAGSTYSTNNYATAGAYQTTNLGSSEMYMAKFTAAGVRQWGTYLGTTNVDLGGDVAADGNFVYLTGYAVGTGLGTAGTHQPNNVGGYDGYLGKFNTSNGSRVWATYYGGVQADFITGITVHTDGTIYLAGYTESATGLGSAGAMQTALANPINQSLNDLFVAKFNTNGTRAWGTYIGAAQNERNTGAPVVDAAGNVYVTGLTSSTSGITTPGSFQPNFAGGAYDIFIVKLNSAGTAKVWSTYWGGTGDEFSDELKMDHAGNLIATGVTGALISPGPGAVSNGLASPGAMHTSPLGNRDAIIGKFSPNGDRIWSTYYGGAGHDYSTALDLDENGNILMVLDGLGSISGPVIQPTTGLSTNCSFQPDIAGGNEIFISKISSDGLTRIWGTYFGGTLNDRAFAIKYLSDGSFLLGGVTGSTSGVVTAGSHQATKSTGEDGFLAKFNEGLAPSDVAVTASTLNPMSQTTCILGIPAIITGNAVSLYNPPGFTSPILFQWQIADAATGPWTDMPGEVFKNLQPLASQTAKYYRRLVQVNNGFCDKKTVDSSAVASVLVNIDISPIANANGPQWYLCASPNNTVTLNGSASGGSGVYSSYQWYAGSNLTTPAFTGADFTPAVTSTTTYTLKVTDNAGCVDVDQVTVTPVIANAGPDQSLCQNSGGVQIGTVGIAGGAVSYSWTLSTGASAAATLSCINCAQPVANPAATTTYRLTTTVTREGGSTCSSTDDVIVAFVAAPTGGATFGGTDKNICKSSTVVLGGAEDAAATYNWSPISYLSASNIYNPTFNAGTNTVKCPMVYTVTATKSGCTFTDQVNVTVVDASTSLDNQTVSCEAWSSGNSNNCSGATYSWELVSGPGVVPTGLRLRNGGADAYLTNTGATSAVYRRVTTVNGLSCTSANITISPCAGGTGVPGCPPITITTMTPQGCPKVFGEQELQLYVSGINAADYNFSWTPANIMDNPTAAIITITSTAATTVNVTVTNKYTGLACSAPALAINNPSWSLPVLNIADKSTCPSVPVAIGEPAVAGYSYLWSPLTELNSHTIANPVATVVDSRSYQVTKTDNGSGCKTSGSVNVLVRAIDFDAGNDRAICNGATATLGTTPAGTYTYSWTPLGAAWTNGTGPTDAQPQVLFAGSSQTFNVTITDPLTGCQKTDAVTLRGTAVAGEYAGTAPGAPYCPGETIQLGRAAEPNATYSWSPATGLTCTSCANPVATAGNTSQTYTVEVSYPGCSTPVTDDVTITVNSLPAVVLTDKTVCPTTPTNIGIGGTGNTASLANVASFEWSPATGLSCTNCASPNANPVAVTTYKVVITFTSGCTLEREVTVTPSVTATAKPDATICPGGSVVLGSPATTNVTYAWSVLSGTAGSITPTNVAQPTANPTVTSIYRLTATGTGPKAGCTITDDVQIIVKTLPAFTITGNTSVCTGGTASLAVSPVTPNVIYQWSPRVGVASPDSSSTTIIPAATTTYRVTQTDLNSGCSDYNEVVVTVWPNNVSATGGSITVCSASSASMPLTVTPASGNTIAWSPATDLSNPYSQNPTITPQSGGNYIATVTNNASNCSDTALVTVIVPTSCLDSDFGDAPVVYENGDPASHGISTLLKIGAAIDAEGAPVSAASSALAVGDDNSGQINDEEGISFLPAPNTVSRSLGLVVNNVLNNTGTTAYLVAWIDFNRDGDFDDTGERSQIIPLATGASSVDPVLQFTRFNTGCVVKAGLSYLRVRVTTDISGSWDTNPAATGDRANGEVEDYSLVIAGSDFGDAPAVYPVARALVNPDLNNDGRPDDAGSVWLGTIADYIECESRSSTLASADDQDGTDDEDGLNTNGTISPNTTMNWNITVNSQGPVTGVQWGMWIDWNADGVFDAFYNGSVNTASPVTIPVSVTAAANTVSDYIARIGVKTGTAFTSADYNYPVTNGEWEDYIGPQTTLSVTLVSFTASQANQTVLLKWKTADEKNSDHFVVQRSNNGLNWEQIGRINAAGNSSATIDYSLIDPQPFQGINYYRLKTVDVDGKFKLSEIRRVDFRQEGNGIAIFPNPTRNAAKLVFAKAPQGNVTVQIWNNMGQIIKMYNLTGSRQTYDLNVMDIPQGVYHITVSGEGINEHIKLMIH